MLRFLLLFTPILATGILSCSDQPKSGADISTTPDERGFIVSVGDNVSDIVFSLTDGTTTSIKELKGNVVMLQFTASWCKVCREEMPFIEKELWQIYKDEGLMIIGVDYDESLEEVIRFKEQMGTTYPMALDPSADIFARFAAKKSGVTRNVILDRNSKIIFLSRLFERKEFGEMKHSIAEELAK